MELAGFMCRVSSDPSLSERLTSAEVDTLLAEAADILPNPDSGGQRGRLPLVAPEDLQRRVEAIAALSGHLLPRLLLRRGRGEGGEGGDDRVGEVLRLTLENCHGLVLQGLAAAAQNYARADQAGTEDAARLCHELLDSVARLMERTAGVEVGGLYVPRVVCRMLVAVFQHCHECGGRRHPPICPKYQRCLKEVFDQCKKIMAALEATLGGEERLLGPSEDAKGAEDLLETARLLADIIKVLPTLDSKYFVRLARLFVQLWRRHRAVLLSAGAFDPKPAEVMSVTSSLVLEQANEVQQLCDQLAEGGGWAESGKKMESHAKKLNFLLRLVKDLADLFCDSLGSNLVPLVMGLAKAISLNRADLEFSSHIPREVKQDVTAGLTSCARDAVDELMIDQGFASSIFGLDFKKGFSGGEETASSYELSHLMALMLHRLPHKNDGTRKLWMPEAHRNLLASLMDASSSCPEFDWEPFVIGVEHSGRGVQAVRAYEHVLTLLQSFVMGAGAREMEIVEQVLVNTALAKTTFWTQAINADLWCFIGRFGSPEYCNAHTLRLLDLLLKLPASHPSWQTLARVAARLSSFVADSGAKEIEELVSDFESDEVELTCLAAVDTTRLGECFRQKLVQHCVGLLGSFSEGELASLAQAEAAMAILCRMRPLLKEDVVREVCVLVATIWQKLEIQTYVPTASRWCLGLFEKLTDLTCVWLKDMGDGELSTTVASFWCVVSSSAFDVAHCFLFLSVLDRCRECGRQVESESVFWRTLLATAASSDALLEMACLRSLRRAPRAVVADLVAGGEVGAAVSAKLRQCLDDAATGEPLGLEVDVEALLRGQFPSVALAPPRGHAAADSSACSQVSDAAGVGQRSALVEISGLVRTALEKALDSGAEDEVTRQLKRTLAVIQAVSSTSD